MQGLERFMLSEQKIMRAPCLFGRCEMKILKWTDCEAVACTACGAHIPQNFVFLLLAHRGPDQPSM